jgi:hypothetical protein
MLAFDFDHRLMLVGVERQAGRRHALHAMALEHGAELLAGRLDPGADRGQCLVMGRQRLQRPHQIVGDRQHVAREGGGCILHGVGLVALEPPAGVLGLGGHAQRPLALGVAAFGQGDDLGAGGGQRRLGRRGAIVGPVGDIVVCCVVRHAINLPSLFAVKSTMGTTRA